MTTAWPSRLLAFGLWALASLSLAYWVLQAIGVSEQPLVADPVAIQAPTVGATDLARVLGPATATPTGAVAAKPPAVNPAANMQLLGVVANRRHVGVALIAIEGQPPRPYRVGSRINDTYTLSRVAARSATLSPTQQGAAAITLELASAVVNMPPRQQSWSAANPAPKFPTANPVAAGVAAAPASRPAAPAGEAEPARD